MKVSVPEEGYVEISRIGNLYVVHLDGVQKDDMIECYEYITEDTPDVSQLQEDLVVWKNYIAEKELQFAKEVKCKDLLKYDSSDAVNGFIIRTDGGDITKWLDTEKRNNAFRAIDSAKKLGDESISFAIGDIPVTLTVATAEIYLARVEKYAVTCTNVTARHKAAINALDTVEAVEAYDFKRFYPEKLIFNVESV